MNKRIFLAACAAAAMAVALPAAAEPSLPNP